MTRPLAAALLLTVACGGPPLPADGGGELTVSIEPTDQLDLLLMIDNSPGIIGQGAFARALPKLLAELAAVPGGTPALHAGVITSDLGAGMIPLPSGGCPLVGGDRGVLRVVPLGVATGPRVLSAPRGTPESIADELALRTHVGDQGCGYEHQLGAVARALDPATIENAGFLRSDAHLAIVMFTDEDDCSAPPDTDLFATAAPDQSSGLVCARAGHLCNGAPPPAMEFAVPMASCQAVEAGPLLSIRTLVDRVRASKRDPDRQVSVEAVFGSPAAHPEVAYRFARFPGGLDYASTCASVLGEAALGLRLPAFVAGFGAGGHVHDICVDDLGPTATAIGKNLARRLTSACLPAPVASCAVTAGGSLPACWEGGARPCWTLEDEPGCAASRTLLVIAGAGALPAGTRIVARCAPGPR
jgi:hypothetical protein